MHDEEMRLEGNAACSSLRQAVEESLSSRSLEGLPSRAREHLEVCVSCREEVARAVRLDALVAHSLSRARARLPGPSPERLDVILAGARERSEEALLLSRFRRTVNRMLWLTFLLLSLLAILSLGWWMLHVLLQRDGH